MSLVISFFLQHDAYENDNRNSSYTKKHKALVYLSGQDSSQGADDVSEKKQADSSSTSDDITIVNHKNSLKSFIEKSPLGMQFAIIVLFSLAREWVISKSQPLPNQPDANTSAILVPFSFTSKEFFDTYSQLALEMGLIKYLVRHIAFAEFMLTLEYLAIIQEDDLAGRYRIRVSFEDLRWIASIALQQIVGGQSLSSPEVFYSSPPRAIASPGAPQPDKAVNAPTLTNTDRSAALVKEIAQSIFAQNELEQYRGGGTGRSNDDAVRPRSRDYGLYLPYFQHRVPPTQYSFRLPSEDEKKRINQEFIENIECIACGEKILLDYFDVWIGEPLEENKRQEITDQRMTEVLADTTPTRSDMAIEEIISYNYHPTERELLSFSYGIIPMDGREAFIAFAKPRKSCPKCGTNPANSVSLMPKY